MASIYPVKRGKYTLPILYIAYMKDGRKMQHPLYHPDTGKRLRDTPGDRYIARRLVTAYEQHELKKRISLEPAMKKFLRSKKNPIYSTVLKKVYNFFGNIKLHYIKQEDIDNLLKVWNRAYKKTSVKTYESYLVVFFNAYKDYMTFRHRRLF